MKASIIVRFASVVHVPVAAVIVEFEGDKIVSETRYYAPHSTPPERT